MYLKKVVFLFIAVCLLPATLSAQIAFDTATDGGNNGGTTTSLAFNHTCASNAVLLVGVLGDYIIGGIDNITSVTYNGTAMTLVAKNAVDGGSGSDRYQYLYVLGTCPSGTHSVSISAATTHYLLAASISYTGVNNSTPIDVSTVHIGTTAPSLTTSLTTSANNEWTVVFAESFQGRLAPTAGTGTTRRVFDATFGFLGFFDSNGPRGAGSNSLQTCLASCSSGTGGTDIIHIIVALNLAGSPPPGVTFTQPTNFAVGNTPVSVVVGDFNGDGKQDLAVANEGSNNVSILLGTGTGSFATATSFAAGSGPQWVAVGDFNGDGKQDLAVANFNDNNVSILLGTGTGSFGTATNIAAGTNPQSVAIG